MASVASRNPVQEAARLEEIAAGAGAALACMHQNAEEMHRALVADYLAKKQARGLWARTLSLLSL